MYIYNTSVYVCIYIYIFSYLYTYTHISIYLSPWSQTKSYLPYSTLSANSVK